MKALLLLLVFVAFVASQSSLKRTFIDFNFNKMFETSLLTPAPTIAYNSFISYENAATEPGAFFTGYLSYTANGSVAPQPGVLLLHDSAGINSFIQGVADQLAQLGYVVFAADYFGSGIRPTSQADQLSNVSFIESNFILLRSRVAAGLTVLSNQPQVDLSRLGALGYGLGGFAALEAARSGLPLTAVISVYGDLTTDAPPAFGVIQGSILALNGASDATVSTDSTNAFTTSLTTLGVDFEFVNYGNAQNGFSDPSRSTYGTYNAIADARSQNEIRAFFHERFGA